MIKLVLTVTVVIVLCYALLAAQPAGTTIGPAAVWNPDTATVRAVFDECRARDNDKLPECFVDKMAAHGASPEAVAFARSMGNDCYLRQFTSAGKVGMAYVAYPFRANENYGLLLVNGSPAVVNVDDLSAVAPEQWRLDMGYQRLIERYPNAAVWPGDRYHTDRVKRQQLPGGGQRFTIGYRMTDGCRACQEIGSAIIDIDFDSAGTLIARRPADVTPLASPKTARSADLQTARGRAFTIALPSNHTTGFSWQLADSLDRTIVRLEGIKYRTESKGPAAGAGGSETWSFKAVAPGFCILHLSYSRPWEKGTTPAKDTTIIVEIRK